MPVHLLRKDLWFSDDDLIFSNEGNVRDTGGRRLRQRRA